MTPLRADAAKWAKLPARARREVIEYFLAEAENSEHDAACIEASQRYHREKERQESLEDAAAFRAAVALLRSATGPGRARRRSR